MARFDARTLRAFVPRDERAYASALVYPRVFTSRQCRRIESAADELDVVSGEVGTGEADYGEDAAVRRARIGWIPDVAPYRWIYDKLTSVVQRANRAYGYDLIGFTEEIQFTHYDEPGAFYDWHQDGLEGDLAGRKLSLVVQLTSPDDYVGADLELFGIQQERTAAAQAAWAADARRQGTVVVFPAFEFHRVTPLVRGARRSLVCWIGGPPFR